MRVSEVIHLHYDDISRSNMQIHVPVSYTHLDVYKRQVVMYLAQMWIM